MKALLLLSAGIDSPVAAHLMLRQGVDLIALHFNNALPSSASSAQLCQKLLSVISAKSKRPIPLIIVQNHASEKRIWENTNHRYQCLICKRQMYRIAEKLAAKNGCSFIVTGENLGQVASQTLDNLIVLNDAVSMPILRPLLCSDKKDIIRQAEEIGTYSLSITHSTLKCPFVPSSPLTKAKLEEVRYQESQLDIDAMVADSLASAAIYK